jgi:hypothetical protein
MASPAKTTGKKRDHKASKVAKNRIKKTQKKMRKQKAEGKITL